MSLEGRRLWLLHVVPGGLRRLLYAKFVWYGLVGVLLVEGLLLLSARQLQIPVPMVWWLAGVGIMASLSLVGLTLGLGAWWIDVHSSDPARIVSSSSGALALVVMLGYVGMVAWSLVMAWSAWGERKTVNRFILVGSGIGPATFAPVRFAVSTISKTD